jgi:glycerol-3-phosphate acyltransferase PlsY
MIPNPLLLALIPLAYLLGSIPFGLIVGRMKGIDPRKAGSGNIGATNVGRLLGGKFFAIVFTLDLLKGLVPMLLAAMILKDQTPTRTNYLLWLLVGFATISGHMFSIFLGFKGGKGVATGAGVALGVFPYFTLPAMLGIIVFLIVFFATRIVSISSIVGSAMLPIGYIVIGLFESWDITGTQLPLLIFIVLLASLIIYRHRGNIARLLAGTESKFEKKEEE